MRGLAQRAEVFIFDHLFLNYWSCLLQHASRSNTVTFQSFFLLSFANLLILHVKILGLQALVICVFGGLIICAYIEVSFLTI